MPLYDICLMDADMTVVGGEEVDAPDLASMCSQVVDKFVNGTYTNEVKQISILLAEEEAES